MNEKATRTVTVIGAAFFGLGGIWALVAPRSFYDVLATYPPFNEHLFHDIGSFQIGIAVGALAGLFTRDVLSVGLAGLASAALLHAVSHFIDAGEGGRSSDPWALSALALLLTAAWIVQWRRRSR